MNHLADESTLDELPDTVFVALGRRGMEALPLKECTYECDGQELKLIEVKKDSVTGTGSEEVQADLAKLIRNSISQVFAVLAQTDIRT